MPDRDVAPCAVRLVQEGEMRLAPDRPWRPFRAEQRMAGQTLDFRWTASFRMAPLAPVRVTDAFENGAGRLDVRAFGLLPIARARGPEIDRGEVLRALAELPWRPFAFRDAAHLTWTAEGPNALRAVFDDGRLRTSVALKIDGEGRVLGGSAGRPRLVGKTAVETAWSGTFGDYRAFGPVHVPATAEVAWLLRDGPFAYWRGRITAYELL